MDRPSRSSSDAAMAVTDMPLSTLSRGSTASRSVQPFNRSCCQLSTGGSSTPTPVRATSWPGELACLAVQSNPKQTGDRTPKTTPVAPPVTEAPPTTPPGFPTPTPAGVRGPRREGIAPLGNQPTDPWQPSLHPHMRQPRHQIHLPRGLAQVEQPLHVIARRAALDAHAARGLRHVAA